MATAERPETDSSITIEAHELLGCFQGTFRRFVYILAKEIAEEKKRAANPGDSSAIVIDEVDVSDAWEQVIERVRGLVAEHGADPEFQRSLDNMQQCFDSKCSR